MKGYTADDAKDTIDVAEFVYTGRLRMRVDGRPPWKSWWDPVSLPQYLGR